MIEIEETAESILEQILAAEKTLAEKTLSFKFVVNSMTNHMRNQWARAGYPGLRKKNPAGPAKFVPPTLLMHRLAEVKK